MGSSPPHDEGGVRRANQRDGYNCLYNLLSLLSSSRVFIRKLRDGISEPKIYLLAHHRGFALTFYATFRIFKLQLVNNDVIYHRDDSVSAAVARSREQNHI
ncbi:hypothetical protein J6590_001264 [Homalodisca vitripennis]|nr:hypothetical protein J6590_001264 [Homalodisca vitripennis]